MKKTPSEVINALMKHWIDIFGVMQAVLTDNGAEFTRDEMKEGMSILNVRTCTTAGMGFVKGFMQSLMVC